LDKLTDKGKDLILFLCLWFIWVVAEILLIAFFNKWILENAWFGFTLYGVDLRVIPVAWLFGIGFAYFLWEVWGMKDYKKWREENKHWLR
jgi:hypothetical protein